MQLSSLKIYIVLQSPTQSLPKTLDFQQADPQLHIPLHFTQSVATIKVVFVWDEAKRRSNLEKHRLDFEDAHLVYDDPEKLTYDASRLSERRMLDLAFALVKGKLLALIYTERGYDVRVISFRPASREEREQYEQDKE